MGEKEGLMNNIREIANYGRSKTGIAEHVPMIEGRLLAVADRNEGYASIRAELQAIARTEANK
jgi:hypothetical protein